MDDLAKSLMDMPLDLADVEPPADVELSVADVEPQSVDPAIGSLDIERHTNINTTYVCLLLFVVNNCTRYDTHANQLVQP
jgi:hypothetical protein